MGFRNRMIYIGLILVMSSCFHFSPNYCDIEVVVKLPFEHRATLIENIEIQLINMHTGNRYKSFTDKQGRAIFGVEYGFYNIVAQHKTNDVIFNGIREQLLVNNNTSITEYLYLDVAKIEQLIIKEIYYSGCIGSDGKKYTKDQFLVIYNNSDFTAYLDSLCLAIVYPTSSVRRTSFLNQDGTLMDRLPAEFIVWQFPGIGKELSLAPGEEIVVACNAINHQNRHPNSVDLSKADYAFWHEDLTMTEVPGPGVQPMKMIWRDGVIKAFSFSIMGSGIILFKCEGDASAYIQSHLMKNPANPQGIANYAMIPQEWVIDGVECVKSAEECNKRLTSIVDAGFVFTSGISNGFSVKRRIDKVKDERLIYMDSNNSTNDFEQIVPTYKL